MEFLKKPLKVYKKFLPTDLPTNAKFMSKILEKYNLSFVKLTCMNFKIGVIPTLFEGPVAQLVRAVHS